MNEDQLVKIKDFVIKCFANDQPRYLFDHNLEHTESVVAHAGEIAKAYQINEKDRFILIAAAWFYDIGHLYILRNSMKKRVQKSWSNFYSPRVLNQ
jgi:HD superfamily phosphodiesterase